MPRAHPEQQLQQAAAELLSRILPDTVLWTAIGHGGGGRVRGAILKSMGLRAGVADLLISWSDPYIRVLWIEMKSKRGLLRPEQKEFRRLVTGLGHGYVVIRSLENLLVALRDNGVPHKQTRIAA